MKNKIRFISIYNTRLLFIYNFIIIFAYISFLSPGTASNNTCTKNENLSVKCRKLISNVR